MTSSCNENMYTPLIIAHRGAAGEAPENTMAAFELALRQGCDAIELDIHLSREDELIVCHDRTIDRTTDGSGIIREMTVSELKQYDAGRWFHETYAGERLPLLREVLELVPPQILLNIEIKETYEGQIEERLLLLLREYNRLEQVVISSFDHKSLRRLADIEPNVKIGLLYTMNAIDHVELANLVGVSVHALHPYHRLIDREDILHVTSHGMQVYPWTINTTDAMQQAIDKGVSGIITDYPGVLKALLSSRNLYTAMK